MIIVGNGILKKEYYAVVTYMCMQLNIHSSDNIVL